MFKMHDNSSITFGVKEQIHRYLRIIHNVNHI